MLQGSTAALVLCVFGFRASSCWWLKASCSAHGGFVKGKAVEFGACRDLCNQHRVLGSISPT